MQAVLAGAEETPSVGFIGAHLGNVQFNDLGKVRTLGTATYWRGLGIELNLRVPPSQDDRVFFDGPTEDFPDNGILMLHTAEFRCLDISLGSFVAADGMFTATINRITFPGDRCILMPNR